MTKLEQAARQALEALEELNYSSGTVVAARMYESATGALREALKENEMAKIEGINTLDRFTPNEQAEQELVAWMWACAECGTEAEDGTDGRICSSCGYHKFYKAPKVATYVCEAASHEQAEQEPVAWNDLSLQEIQAVCNGDLNSGIVVHAAIAAFKEKNAALVQSVSQEPVALLHLAEDALVYHTEQTRPIQNTIDALAAIQKFKENQK